MAKSRTKVAPKKRPQTETEKVESELNKLRPVADDKILAKILKKAPKTARARKVLAAKSPMVLEPTKNLLLLKGTQCSQKGQDILKALSVMRKPYALLLGRRRQQKLAAPLIDHSDFEYLGEKNQAALFGMISTTKKHPLRLFAGRLFAWKLYDLYEFDILDFEPMNIKSKKIPMEGSKPIMIFQGSMWEASPELEGAKNCLADMFGGIKAERVMLDRFDRAITCVIYERKNEETGSTDTVITITQWAVRLKKREEAAAGAAGGVPEFKAEELPSVELEFLGPRLTLKPTGNAKLPERDVVKAAMRIPNEEFEKGKSNKKTATNALRQTRQTVHVDREDLSKVLLRHGNK